jgi:hypothetical protein
MVINSKEMLMLKVNLVVSLQVILIDIIITDIIDIMVPKQ